MVINEVISEEKNVYTPQTISFAPSFQNSNKIVVSMIYRSDLNVGHIGSKTRSEGPIRDKHVYTLEVYFLPSLSETRGPRSLMKLNQNVGTRSH